jgi:hypothetical protein
MACRVYHDMPGPGRPSWGAGGTRGEEETATEGGGAWRMPSAVRHTAVSPRRRRELSALLSRAWRAGEGALRAAHWLFLRPLWAHPCYGWLTMSSRCPDLAVRSPPGPQRGSPLRFSGVDASSAVWRRLCSPRVVQVQRRVQRQPSQHRKGVVFACAGLALRQHQPSRRGGRSRRWGGHRTRSVGRIVPAALEPGDGPAATGGTRHP